MNSSQTYRSLTLSTIAAFLLATTTACGSSSDSKPSSDSTAVAAEDIPLVSTLQVHSTEVPQETEYTANVEAFKTNNISASSPNRIKNILVDVGSHVAKGQKVAIMDNVNIDQLRVRLDNAERELSRARQLLEIGAGTQQTVDQMQTEVDATRRQYTNLIENTTLISPISGVVTARNYDPGDMSGTLPILTIEQVRPVKVLVNISENDFTKIRKGQKVDIRTDVYGDETFHGTVHLIHPSIDPSTRTFTVEVTIDNADERVHPGMFARVLFNHGTANHVVVPDRAVVKQSGSGNKYVYVYHPDNGTVSYNRVELGRRMADTYEVISGVADGDIVVTAGQVRLADGTKVKLQEDK